MGLLIFLDLDGVLRRRTAPKHRLEPHLMKNFGEYVSELEKTEPVNVVLTSTWKTAFSLDQIRSHFPPSLRLKIIGATPFFPPRDGSRQEEILTYLRLNGLERANWLAIDGDPFGFPANPENLLLVDPDEGFTFAPAPAQDQ